MLIICFKCILLISNGNFIQVNNKNNFGELLAKGRAFETDYPIIRRNILVETGVLFDYIH